MRAVLIDAGPLVAWIDADDAHHDEMVEAAKRIREPRFTVWPALTEAMYLLGDWNAQERLWSLLEAGGIRVAPLDAEDIPRMKALMERYRDLPMDLADAALVRVAEREGITAVLTVDRSDFSVYRVNGRVPFELL